MKAVHPYLLFRGNTAEAFEFYERVFDSKIDGVVHFRDFGPDAMGLGGEHGDLIANISLPIAPGVSLMGNDVPESMDPDLRIGGNVQITLEPDDVEHAHRLFDALAEGGRVGQGLRREPFAELYGEVIDRFGTSWIIIVTGDVQFGA